MPLTLGLEAQRLTVLLNTGADFAHALEAKDAGVPVDWPAGTVIELVFATWPPTVWAATLDGNVASWQIPEAQADLIPTGTPAVLWHRLDGLDTPWAVGEVYRP